MDDRIEIRLRPDQLDSLIDALMLASNCEQEENE